MATCGAGAGSSATTWALFVWIFLIFHVFVVGKLLLELGPVPHASIFFINLVDVWPIPSGISVDFLSISG